MNARLALSLGIMKPPGRKRPFSPVFSIRGVAMKRIATAHSAQAGPPSADALEFRLVQGGLIAALLALAVSAVWEALAGRGVPLVLALVFWLPLAWGLWRRHRLARLGVLAVLWVLLGVLPLGVLNPFAAIDGGVPLDMPLWRLALPIFALVAVVLFMIHVLDKYRAVFGQHERRK